jgi:hypothetical protein
VSKIEYTVHFTDDDDHANPRHDVEWAMLGFSFAPNERTRTWSSIQLSNPDDFATVKGLLVPTYPDIEDRGRAIEFAFIPESGLIYFYRNEDLCAMDEALINHNISAHESTPEPEEEDTEQPDLHFPESREPGEIIEIRLRDLNNLGTNRLLLYQEHRTLVDQTLSRVIARALLDMGPSEYIVVERVGR